MVEIFRVEPAVDNRVKTTKAGARRALNVLLAKADDYAMRGSMHPLDQPDIERAYQRAINRMEDLLGLSRTTLSE